VKIITSGEGGMALTNDDELATRLAMLRSHGITRDASRYRGTGRDRDDDSPDAAGWYYEQQMLGFNYRLIDIQPRWERVSSTGWTTISSVATSWRAATTIC